MGMTTKKVYPVAYSLTNLGGQIGSSLAPFLVGVILDAYSWDAVFVFLAVSSIISLLLIISIEEPMNDILPERAAGTASTGA
jgi:sugar phosphate permease